MQRKMKGDKSLFRYIFRQKMLFIGGFLLTIFCSITTLLPAKLGQEIVKELLTKSDFSELILFLALGLIIVIFSGIFESLKNYTINVLGKKVIKEIRADIFKNVLKKPYSYFQKRNTGDIISRAVNDTYIIEEFIQTHLKSIFKDPLVIIGALIMMFITNALFSLILIGLTPFLIIGINLIRSRLKKQTAILQSEISRITSIFKAILDQIKQIKVFKSYSTENLRFNERLTKYFNESKKAVFAGSLVRPLVDVIGGVSIIIILSVAFFFIKEGNLRLDQFTAFAFYFMILSSPMQTIGKYVT